jgi:catabolite regulation protein CreA
MVNLLCSDQLETNLDFEIFKETAELIFKGTEKSKIFKDTAKFEVLLYLLYLDTLYYGS